MDKKVNINDILQALNNEQREAVTHAYGSLLVCAGAGSGKTRVIASRIAYLIKVCGVSPRSIIALTFTNKAAREMHERVASLISDEHTELPIVTTFHGYALRILKKHWRYANTDVDHPWGIMDEQDQTALMTRIMKECTHLPALLTPKKVLSFISRIKNGMHNSQDSSFELHINALHKKYEEEKNKAYVFDFDDLLIRFLELLHKPEFLLNLRMQVRHLLIDEYQDTNTVQHAIVKKMCLDNSGSCVMDSVCVVGDEDQSIYSWRGAVVTNIMNFPKDFRDTKSITIAQNYRSVLPVLQVANALIAHNSDRTPKKLWSDKPAQQRAAVLTFSSGYQEAESAAIAIKILQKIKSDHECAILYRSHYQSRLFEEMLLKYGIPYVIIGGINFYERQEIKDIISYLRLAVNPRDRAAFLRCYNSPTRGLGEKFEEQLFDLWDMHHDSTILEVLVLYMKDENNTSVRSRGVNALIETLQGLTEHMNSAAHAVEYIVQKTGYTSYLKRTCEPKEYDERVDNIQELVSALFARAERGVSDVASFLEDVALLQDVLINDIESNDQIISKVKLMTLHGAKGLEFETVFLVGLEEGIIPSGRAHELEQIEEERRLLYVGITRAREQLICMHAKTRHLFGALRIQEPSRFLSELPEQLARIDFSLQPYYILEKNMQRLVNELFQDVPFLTGALYGKGKVDYKNSASEWMALLNQKNTKTI